MFDYIDSKYTKSRYEEVGFMLTDMNAATLIWNKYTLSYEDKMSALAKLGETTSDIELKRQIAERVDYENLILKEFKENHDAETIYMVRDWEDEEVYGLFSTYDTALKRAQKKGGEDGVDMLIEKHIIVTGDTIPKMKNMDRLNPNLFPDEEEMWMERIMNWFCVIIRFLVGRRWEKVPFCFMGIHIVVKKMSITRHALLT